MFTKLPDRVNLTGLKKEVDQILSGQSSLQVGLQSNKPDGSWKDAIGKGTYMKETDFIYPVFDLPSYKPLHQEIQYA